MPGTVLDEGDMILDSSVHGRHLYTQYAIEDAMLSNYGNPAAAYGSGSSYEGYGDARMQLYPGYDFGGNIAGSPIKVPADGDLTIEAVVRFNDDKNDMGLIFSNVSDANTAYWYGNQSQIWFRAQVDGKIRIWMQATDGSYSWTESTTNVYDGQWHHVAAVRDTTAGVIKVYIDHAEEGSVIDTMTADINPPSSYMVLGGFPHRDDRNVEGSIDFVKVTRAALTPAAFEQPKDLPAHPDPVDYATGIPTTYTLGWTPIPNATITSQSVVLATDPYIQEIVATIAASGNTAQMTDLTKSTNYYWRVDTEGSDADGSFIRQGPVWNFRSISCLVKVSEGDLNEDCTIDLLDFAIMASNWLRSESE
jgi:hypothetical protein